MFTNSALSLTGVFLLRHLSQDFNFNLMSVLHSGLIRHKMSQPTRRRRDATLSLPQSGIYEEGRVATY